MSFSDASNLLDKEFFRRTIPLAVVCAELGIALDDGGIGICPFHDDHTPSFGLWHAVDDTERWGCFVCDVTGDHYSLVQRVRTCSFGESVRFVSGLVDSPAPHVRPRERVDLDEESLKTYVAASQRHAALDANAGLLCVAVGLRSETVSYAERVHVDERLRDLGWGVDDRCNVVMPHYRPDLSLAGAKVRSISGAKWSFPGSRFDSLYGSWRPNLGGYDECLLVEGETDYAHAVMSDAPVYVLSVPSGAKFRDDWLRPVASFSWVYLAFDPDKAGLRASETWRQNLATVSVSASTLPIPDGEDLRSCGVPVGELIEHAV